MNNFNAKGIVLVTGGTGFLGAYIIRELVENDFAVRAIHRGGPMPFFLPDAIREKVNETQQASLGLFQKVYEKRSAEAASSESSSTEAPKEEKKD